MPAIHLSPRSRNGFLPDNWRTILMRLLYGRKLDPPDVLGWSRLRPRDQHAHSAHWAGTNTLGCAKWIQDSNSAMTGHTGTRPDQICRRSRNSGTRCKKFASAAATRAPVATNSPAQPAKPSYQHPRQSLLSKLWLDIDRITFCIGFIVLHIAKSSLLVFCSGWKSNYDMLEDVERLSFVSSIFL